MPAAVPRLVRLVPPARLDLVDEVLARVGRRDLNLTLDLIASCWTPASTAGCPNEDAMSAPSCCY